MIEWTLVINLIGIVVGLYSVITIHEIKKEFAGKLANSLSLFQFGIFFMLCYFGGTIALTNFHMLPEASPSMYFYQLLLTMGMIFFAFGATTFASAVWSSNDQ